MSRANYLQSLGTFDRIVIFLLVIIAVIVITPASAGAQDNRSFYFPSVVIEAEVRQDGSMLVVEERTFRFDGRYRGAWVYIPLKFNATIRDVTVGEGGLIYEQKPVGTQDIPGVYYVDYQGDQVYIDWSFEANNEDRTFIISYVVDNAVLVHNDVAELYWQFIGDEWDEKTDYARVILYLPEGAAAESIRAWGHGPLDGSVRIVDAATVEWIVEDLPARTFLEGRVAFPLQLVTQAANYSGREGLPGMLEDEEKWAREANLKRTLGRVDFLLGPTLILVGFIYYLISLIKARRHPDAYRGDYFRDLPGEYSPAEAGYLIRKGRTGPEDFTATVMDLARRDIFVSKNIRQCAVEFLSVSLPISG